jgi:hypothetical protein
MEEADAKLADGALSATDDSPAVSEELTQNNKKRWRCRMTTAAVVAVALAAPFADRSSAGLG